ncbi:MAG: FtsQ-type POTRA domain-containing protein [bacterium]
MDDILKKMLIFLGLCIAGCFCYGIGIQYSKWIDDSEKFCLQDIEVQGNIYFSKEEILQECGIKKDESIWNLDLKSMNKNLTKNPFLEEIHIYRCFPDKLVISVQEKKPVALLKVNGAFLTLDRNGLVLPSKIGKMYDLPLISGDFKGRIGVGYQAGGKKLKFSLNLLNMIIDLQPRLYSEISEIMVKDKDEVWFFTTRYGIPVKAGKDKWIYKINCLTEVMEKLLRNNELNQIKYIDLRYRDQIIVGKRT